MIPIHQTAFLIALLSFLDAFLTLKGFKINQQAYSKHFISKTYELNPAFREQIHQRKYPRSHPIRLFFTIFILYLMYYFNPIGYPLVQGAFISMFVYLNALHIKNILIFNFVRDSKSVKGKVHLSKDYSLAVTRYDAFSSSLLLFPVFIFFPSLFTFGLILGPLLIAIMTYFW